MKMIMVAAGLSALLASPLVAQHADHHSPTQLVTLAEWTDRMNEMLDLELRRMPQYMWREQRDGVVRVKFNCAENGRPDKVALLKSSGSRVLDMQALRAVGKLASLHPLPTGLKPEQNYVAVLVFASGSSDPLLKVARDELKRSNGWYHDPTTASRNDKGGVSLAARY